MGLTVLSHSPMKFIMLGSVRQQQQVRKPVVIFDFVNMMHNFFSSEESTNSFFYNESVLRNIHFVIVRMIRGVFMEIPMSFFNKDNFAFISTFFRAIFPSTRFKTVRLYKKFFSTLKAINFNTSRIGFSHTSPRASSLMFCATYKFFSTLFASLMIFARHKAPLWLTGYPFMSNYTNKNQWSQALWQ